MSSKKSNIERSTRQTRQSSTARTTFEKNMVARNNVMTACDVTVCRICFAINCRLYPMPTHKMLRKAYEELTGLMLENENHLPPYVCDQCKCQLLSCARFRTKTLQSHLILLEIVKKHDCVTLDLIHSITGAQNARSLKVTHHESDQHDLEIEQEEQSDMSSVFHKVIPVDEIKKEKDDEINQDVNEKIEVIKVENDVINQNIINGESTSGITIEIFKVENKAIDREIDNENTTFEVIKTEIEVYEHDIDTKKNEISCKSLLQGDTVVDGVKIANVDHTVSEEMTNDHEMNREALAGENCSSDKNPPRRKRQKAKPKSTRAQKVAKVKEDKNQTNAEEHQQSSVDSRLVNEEYTCDLCPYKTITVVQLLTHLKAHAASSSYSCDVCNYRTISKDNMACHDRMHSGEKPYSCTVCNKAFNRKAHLHQHQRIHTGEKPYSCDVCNRAFHRKTDLQNHSRIHSGEKPYVCKVCNEAFSRKCYLQYHLSIHLGKKYLCDVCKKAFSRRDNLQDHMRTHFGKKSYSCDICKKKFIRKFHLQTHIRTHTGEKPYSCITCNKAYSSKKNLQMHMLKHSDVKP